MGARREPRTRSASLGRGDAWPARELGGGAGRGASCSARSRSPSKNALGARPAVNCKCCSEPGSRCAELHSGANGDFWIGHTRRENGSFWRGRPERQAVGALGPRGWDRSGHGRRGGGLSIHTGFRSSDRVAGPQCGAFECSAFECSAFGRGAFGRGAFECSAFRRHAFECEGSGVKPRAHSRGSCAKASTRAPVFSSR